MRIIVPVLEKKGKDSRVSPHFGRAPYLAIVEVLDGEINNLDFVEGEGPHEENREEGEKAKASSIHGRVIQIKPDAIIASRIGPRAVEDFTKAGIKILAIEGSTISEVTSKIKSYSLTSD